MFWQTLPHHISPYLFDAGFFRLHWYGFMYVVAFSVAALLIWYRVKHEKFLYTKEQIFDLLFWLIFGLLIGGRLGYVLVYEPMYYLSHPLQIFSPFGFVDGNLRLVGIAGMSYHGGLIGGILAGLWFAKKRRMDIWELVRFVVPTIPLAYFFGRIGNFINGELYGRATDVPWGMYFPRDPSGVLRHPSQLYEALLEGLLLFAVLWMLKKKNFFKGFFLGAYIIGYGIARFFVEFFREPDPQLGAIALGLTMGQILSGAMIVGGTVFLVVMKRKDERRI